MRMFKKRGPDVVDLTQLQRKGTLQRSRALVREKEGSINQDVVDLGTMKGVVAREEKQISRDNNVSSGFDFLSNFADIGKENSSNISKVSNTGENLDVAGLKNKIEDIEYKLEKFIERINKIENQLSELGR